MQQDTFQHRFYRSWTTCGRLHAFNVQVDETDLAVKASLPLRQETKQLVVTLRQELLSYAKRHPRFFTSLRPLEVEPDAPEIAKLMADASARFGVGPMAAVAGAIAELAGRDLLRRMAAAGVERPELIIENGGDCFIKTESPARVQVCPGAESPFAGKLAIRIDSAAGPRGVCTSSGTVGHSLSFGSADAVVAVAESAALADAAATAIGNEAREERLIGKILEKEKSRGRLMGLMIVMGERCGAWGGIELA